MESSFFCFYLCRTNSPSKSRCQILPSQTMNVLNFGKDILSLYVLQTQCDVSLHPISPSIIPFLASTAISILLFSTFSRSILVIFEHRAIVFSLCVIRWSLAASISGLGLAQAPKLPASNNVCPNLFNIVQQYATISFTGQHT